MKKKPHGSACHWMFTLVSQLQFQDKRRDRDSMMAEFSHCPAAAMHGSVQQFSRTFTCDSVCHHFPHFPWSLRVARGSVMCFFLLAVFTLFWLSCMAAFLCTTYRTGNICFESAKGKRVRSPSDVCCVAAWNTLKFLCLNCRVRRIMKCFCTVMTAERLDAFIIGLPLNVCFDRTWKG